MLARQNNCQILRDGVEVRRRWAEYFEQVLNVAYVREAVAYELQSRYLVYKERQLGLIRSYIY